MLNAVAAIARQAGQMMLNIQNAAIHKKEGHFNFVTDADVQVQQFLRGELAALLPASRFYAEEQENAPLTDELTFVVDPIDGTLNYMRHRNVSAVSIGLLEKKRPILGVVCNPYADETFTAEKGKGAFVNGLPVHVSSNPFENAMVSFGTSPYDADLAERSIAAARLFLIRAGDLRRSGSAAVDLCDVACGRSDIFFELRLRPWDVAAGSLLVTEAGGTFLSLGHSLPYYEGPSGILACNQACYEKALNVLKEAIA